MSFAEKKDIILNFEGPIVANVTQFKDDGSIAVEDVDSYVDYLVANGVKGAYVFGTTGEGLSLQNSEKLTLAEKWIKKGKATKGFLTIINVSATSIRDSIEQARKCEASNADGMAVLPPIYYRPSNVDELVQYLKEIGDAAPNVPLIYYHFPEITHVPVDLASVIEKALEKVPSFVGMKYTSKDIIEVQRLQQNFAGRFKVFIGYEETLLPGLVSGINSGICALFNLPGYGQVYSKMIEAVKKNDLPEARKEHLLISEKVQALTKQGSYFVNVKKALKADQGLKFVVGKLRTPAYS